MHFILRILLASAVGASAKTGTSCIRKIDSETDTPAVGEEISNEAMLNEMRGTLLSLQPKTFTTCYDESRNLVTL